MLRLDDLTVRTAELNRAAAAIERTAWMTAGPDRTDRPHRLGSAICAVIDRVARNGSPAANAAASTLRPA